MARNKSTNTTNTDDKPTTELPEKLFGANVTPENVAALAGVDVGVFPQTIALTNATSSEMTFAELGVSLLPYEQQHEVVIRNQGALDTFCMNYAYLAALSQWNERQGVFVQAVGKE